MIIKHFILQIMQFLINQDISTSSEQLNEMSINLLHINLLLHHTYIHTSYNSIIILKILFIIIMV